MSKLGEFLLRLEKFCFTADPGLAQLPIFPIFRTSFRFTTALIIGAWDALMSMN